MGRRLRGVRAGFRAGGRAELAELNLVPQQEAAVSDGHGDPRLQRGDPVGNGNADYNEAIRLNSRSPIAFNNRCDEQLLVGQVQAALADCNEALRQRPNLASTLMHRGNAHLAAGEFDLAIADYNAALKLNTKDAWSLYRRGYAKSKRGDVVGGTADMETAKSIRPDIASGFASRGIK